MYKVLFKFNQSTSKHSIPNLVYFYLFRKKKVFPLQNILETYSYFCLFLTLIFLLLFNQFSIKEKKNT